MFKEDIKVCIPTESISKAVQEKLYELGYSWGVAGNSKPAYTKSPYLYAFHDGVIAHNESPRFFETNDAREAHFLQVLVGDLDAKLYRNTMAGDSPRAFFSQYCIHDRKIYFFDSKDNELAGDECRYTHDMVVKWVNNPYVDEIDVRGNVVEEKPMKNEMPLLEAGKHVIMDNHGATFLVVTDTQNSNLAGVGIGSNADEWVSNLGNNAARSVNWRIDRVYEITKPYMLMDKPIGNQRLVWTRKDEVIRKQYDEIQEQIRILTEKADKLGESL